MSDDESDQEVQVVVVNSSARPKSAAAAAAVVALPATAGEEVIELLSDDEDDDDDESEEEEESDDAMNQKPRALVVKPAAATRASKSTTTNKAASTTTTGKKKPQKKTKAATAAAAAAAAMRPLQAGLVLEEDVDECVKQSAAMHNNAGTDYDDNDDDDDDTVQKWTLTSYIEQQQANKKTNGKIPVELYHDDEFESTPASIEGASRQGRVEKCFCNLTVGLSYSTREGPNHGRPYHHCGANKPKATTRCRYFRWAFTAQKMHWYRFGCHTGHVLVQNAGFSANDLLQGRVGDCWFLSALAVIAERQDLIARIFGADLGAANNNPYGIVQVNLFLDGFWKNVTMDNFLPCIINESGEEDELQAALKASMSGEILPNSATSTRTTTTTTNAFAGTGYTLSGSSLDGSTMQQQERKKNDNDNDGHHGSSKYDPFCMSDKNRQVLANTENFLQQHQSKPANPYAKKPPPTYAATAAAAAASGNVSLATIPSKLDRIVTTQDLAYSKAKNNQLWVPFLEKAYAKSHGSYQAISGGHIAEAFLDLTGAPTRVYRLLNDSNFEPRGFWYQLLSYHRQGLPMGCGTSSSAAGIIGMHAYSIIAVKEISGISPEFFQDKLLEGTLGNVSGFTSFDGKVRLLRIRNPHGKGEWKGEFSDRSGVWEKLLKHKQYDSQVSDLERTMRDDGTFWIDYDSFLMGFSNVDVVLAFRGNCARSFQCNFPEKKSNHRCTRAFEVSLLDPQPGVPSRDTVELYVMGIQKTRRGASHGRVDRKVSYKISDMGILVGDTVGRQQSDQFTDKDNDDEDLEFHSVEGEMFGFKRNGHFRLILNRKKHKRLIVMPISFGHPAATDKDRSFALRFVADSPLYIRELSQVPQMDRVLANFCFSSQPDYRPKQQKRKILLEDNSGIQKYGEPLYRVFQIDCLANQGGVVFVYLCMNERLLELKGIRDFSLDLAIEATCRGMMCRTETGFLKHETLAKGKKFEAAWRKFNTEFHSEATTRLLMVLVQAGQDSEMGSCTCSKVQKLGGKVQATISSSGTLSTSGKAIDFDKLGIFNGLSSRSSSCIHNEGLHASMFGRNAAASNSISMGILDVFDLDLERALALSRGDIEMKEALELSMRDKGPFSPGVIQRNGDAMTEDRELQLAIERSTAAISGPSSFKTYVEAIDDDINEAIKRSLVETKASSLKQAPGKVREAEVIDLDSMENLDQKPSAKRRKVADESVIEIIDDEEEEGEQQKEENGATSNKSDTTILTAVEKRRLAAEAAEKRFRAKTD